MKLQTLKLNNNELRGTPYQGADAAIGFWERQFMQTRTSAQTRFDWAYGVVIPLFCVVADPIVFADRGILTEYRPFAYLLSSASILAMAAWLLWGDRLRWLAAPLGGLFIAGSVISFLVGVILLPYSIIGLFYLIGLLGFTPLFAGFVYLRNGLRAMGAAESFMDEITVWKAAILTAILALVIPYIVNAPVSWTIQPL
jgi:hypothetical protein